MEQFLVCFIVFTNLMEIVLANPDSISEDIAHMMETCKENGGEWLKKVTINGTKVTEMSIEQQLKFNQVYSTNQPMMAQTAPITRRGGLIGGFFNEIVKKTKGTIGMKVTETSNQVYSTEQPMMSLTEPTRRRGMFGGLFHKIVKKTKDRLQDVKNVIDHNNRIVKKSLEKLSTMVIGKPLNVTQDTESHTEHQSIMNPADSTVMNEADSTVMNQADSIVMNEADSTVMNEANTVINQADSIVMNQADSAVMNQADSAVMNQADSAVMNQADRKAHPTPASRGLLDLIKIILGYLNPFGKKEDSKVELRRRNKKNVKETKVSETDICSSIPEPVVIPDLNLTDLTLQAYSGSISGIRKLCESTHIPDDLTWSGLSTVMKYHLPLHELQFHYHVIAERLGVNHNFNWTLGKGSVGEMAIRVGLTCALTFIDLDVTLNFNGMDGEQQCEGDCSTILGHFQCYLYQIVKQTLRLLIERLKWVTSSYACSSFQPSGLVTYLKSPFYRILF